MLVSADLELTIIISGLATWELICGGTMKVMDVFSEWVSWWLLFSPGILVFNANLQSNWRKYSLFSLMNGVYFLVQYFTVLSVVVEYHPVPCAVLYSPPHYKTKDWGIAAIPSAPPAPPHKPTQMTVNCVLCIVLPKGKQNTEVYVLFAKTKFTEMSVVCHTDFFSFQDRFCRQQDLGKFWNCSFLV